MTTKFVIPTLIVLVLVSACGKNETKPLVEVGSTTPIKFYNNAELDKLIVVGMTMEHVTNTLGLPSSAVNEDENKIHLLYMFRFEANRTGMSGFSIGLKDGRVVRWDPITQGAGYGLQSGASQGSFGEQSFEVFWVIENLTNVTNLVNLQGSANASDLKVPPDLTFTAKVFAGDSGSDHSGEQSVILVVSDQDASKLKDLSQNNLGKRLLIVCRNKAIAAPFISAQLVSRQVAFTVKDSNILNGLKEN